MDVVTPEDFLGVPSPFACFHHGSCDVCRARFVVVLHLNYDVQPDRDFRICRECCIKHRLEFLMREWL